MNCQTSLPYLDTFNTMWFFFFLLSFQKCLALKSLGRSEHGQVYWSGHRWSCRDQKGLRRVSLWLKVGCCGSELAQTVQEDHLMADIRALKDKDSVHWRDYLQAPRCPSILNYKMSLRGILGCFWDLRHHTHRSEVQNLKAQCTHRYTEESRSWNGKQVG